MESELSRSWDREEGLRWLERQRQDLSSSRNVKEIAIQTVRGGGREAQERAGALARGNSTHLSTSLKPNK